MEALSEKILYEKEAMDVLDNTDAEDILWGEDLYEAKIIVYPKKIKDIPGYEEIKNDLINVAVVYLDSAKEQILRASVVRCIWEKELLYIAECNFNAIWKFLRNSVDLGLRIQREKGEELRIGKADDIIDMSLLESKGCYAVLKQGKINYVARALPQEYIRAQSRKQSALDNFKNRYFYDITSEVYHDKSCDCISAIEPINFMASVDVPEGLRPCKECRRKMYLRDACFPNVKIIPSVDYLLTKSGIKDFQLEMFTYDHNLKFRYDTKNELKVIGKEDTWIIKGFENNRLVLWHNNYKKLGPEERYIADGFHKQGLEGKSLYKMLDYIKDYTYAGHLNAKKHLDKAEAEITNENVKQNKTTLWSRVTDFISRICDSFFGIFN